MGILVFCLGWQEQNFMSRQRHSICRKQLMPDKRSDSIENSLSGQFAQIDWRILSPVSLTSAFYRHQRTR